MSFDTKTKKFDTPYARELAYLAALVAVEAPTRANKWASDAKVPWELVGLIRDTLTKAGFDWKTASEEAKRVQRERKVEEQRRRYPQ